DILRQKGQEKTREFLSKFSCPLNADVEDFIRNKAITFALQGLAAVWIVFASYKEKYVPVGYFALANKHFHIDTDKMNSKNRRQIQKFGTFDIGINKYIVSAPLIGQLGKNYHNDYNSLITGDELLDIACTTVKEAHWRIGGRLVYLECENIPSLINFYQRNGFFNFGRRNLDRAEKDKLKGDYLIQFFKSLRDEEEYSTEIYQ
ncbi:MAG: hypothetical protein IJU91_03145, partial [Selenomonadaceae bacterium]|nr:hypothetical protein [Selenomonadaceae bacterium]